MKGIFASLESLSGISRRITASRSGAPCGRRGTGAVAAALALAGLAAAPMAAWADKSNPVCPSETVLYNPGNGEDIVVPSGFTVSVFAKDLNAPVGVAFRGD